MVERLWNMLISSLEGLADRGKAVERIDIIIKKTNRSWECCGTC